MSDTASSRILAFNDKVYTIQPIQFVVKTSYFFMVFFLICASPNGVAFQGAEYCLSDKPRYRFTLDICVVTIRP